MCKNKSVSQRNKMFFPNSLMAVTHTAYAFVRACASWSNRQLFIHQRQTKSSGTSRDGTLSLYSYIVLTSHCNWPGATHYCPKADVQLGPKHSKTLRKCRQSARSLQREIFIEACLLFRLF